MSKQHYHDGGAEEIYLASTQAGVTTSVALSATQTGFTLTNPFGSGKTLVVLRINAAFTTAPAGACPLTITANVNPVATAVVQTTPLTVRKANLGVSGTGVGLAASSVTLPAVSVVVRPLGGAVAASSITPPYINDDVNGEICVAPGCALSVNSVTTAAVAVISMVWKEVDEIA
jgi:hypothetical protein